MFRGFKDLLPWVDFLSSATESTLTLDGFNSGLYSSILLLVPTLEKLFGSSSATGDTNWINWLITLTGSFAPLLLTPEGIFFFAT